jgi:peroxiredoxin
LEDIGFSTRATFVIDASGIVVAKFVTAPGQARDLASYKSALELV